jgi:hypothetical protein
MPVCARAMQMRSSGGSNDNARYLSSAPTHPITSLPTHLHVGRRLPQLLQVVLWEPHVPRRCYQQYTLPQAPQQLPVKGAIQVSELVPGEVKVVVGAVAAQQLTGGIHTMRLHAPCRQAAGSVKRAFELQATNAREACLSGRRGCVG